MIEIIAGEKVTRWIAGRGGHVWVWLDPHRSIVGAHTYLEAHTEPPRTSLETKFSRSSRRPHAFYEVPADGFTVHLDHADFEPPKELHFELKGWQSKRVEAYWDGCIFVDAIHPDWVDPQQA